MKIESIEIIGLHGNKEPIFIDFNDDLNIITGKNGAGKTTLIKIIWYVISANYHYLAEEHYNFEQIKVKTNRFHFRVFYGYDETLKLDLFEGSKELMRDAPIILQEHSLFFPTYRLIESDMDITKNLTSNLIALSKNLTKVNHKFIASVGTSDIKELLTKKYSEISEELNLLNENTYKSSLTKLSNLIENGSKEPVTDDTLIELKNELENTILVRNDKMKAINIFKQTVAKFIKHSSITIGEEWNSGKFKIGDAVDAISSDQLSAGEKQMLSFIAYNTFYEDTIFIIDEPELSLHVDWQRQLIPTLLEQGTSNQFILATHSPFIYANYPDKEIQLLDDKGYNENFAEESISNKHEG